MTPRVLATFPHGLVMEFGPLVINLGSLDDRSRSGLSGLFTNARTIRIPLPFFTDALPLRPLQVSVSTAKQKWAKGQCKMLPL